MGDQHESKRIFQQVPDGRLLAIRNWRHRKKGDDALVAVPLTEEELVTYRKLKAAGTSDEQVFDKLFKKPIEERFSLSIEHLTKDQLLMLIRQIVGSEINTLDRMTQPDLVTLLRTLCRDRAKCEAYLV